MQNERTERPLRIDHIAVCPLFASTRAWGWPADDGGITMSDHSGVGAKLATSRPATYRAANSSPGV